MLADSKGNYLKLYADLINQFRYSIEFQCRGGARFQDYFYWLQHNLSNKFAQYDKIVLYVWLGTCDFTVKSDLQDPTVSHRNFKKKNYIQLRHATDTEAEIKVPCLGTEVFHIPLLVVADTQYNSKVPAIIGTNVIRLFRQTSPQTDIPVEWTTAFDSLCNDTLPVKTCNNYNIRVGPGEVKVLNGIVRKTGKMDTAVTEHIDSSLSGDLTIYLGSIVEKPRYNCKDSCQGL